MPGTQMFYTYSAVKSEVAKLYKWAREKKQWADFERVKEDKSVETACCRHSLGLLNSNIWQTAREKGNISAESATSSISLQNPTKKSPPLDELFPLSSVWVEWENNRP
jgi:hypothetical protein